MYGQIFVSFKIHDFSVVSISVLHIVFIRENIFLLFLLCIEIYLRQIWPQEDSYVGQLSIKMQRIWK